jgi:retinol dehydrogenase-12
MSSSPMQGKLCLVTGATFGIGKETALGLSRLGALVVIVGRDEAKTHATAKEIAIATGGDVYFLIGDLSSQAEVRRLAAEFRKRFGRLDVLVNNAGGIFTERQLTVDGIERTWALNHLAYFVLTLELLDLLEASRGRIVNVSSNMHKAGHIDFDDLQADKGYSAMRRYGESKLANVLFTNALARRLAGTGVTVNSVHPGAVATGFGRNNPGLFAAAIKIAAPFMLTPAKGARTSIYLASSPEVAGVTGKYFAKCKPARENRDALDEKLQERLWAISVAQTEKTAPKATATTARA